MKVYFAKIHKNRIIYAKFIVIPGEVAPDGRWYSEHVTFF